MKIDYFRKIMSVVAESQGWRPLGDMLLDLWLSTANKLPEATLLALSMSFCDTPGQKPADFLKALKEAYKRHIADTTPKTIVPRAELCEEMVRFHKITPLLIERKRSECPYGDCASRRLDYTECSCLAELWDMPLEDADWQAVQDMNPVAKALGGSPQPDPKENDLVWIDG